MKIILPKFNRRYFDVLIACGQLEPTVSVFDDLIKDGPKEFAADYGTKKNQATLIVFVSKTKEYGHLHVEAFKKNSYKNREPRQEGSRRADLAELQSIIESASEQEAIVNLTAEFLVPFLDLPEDGLIRSAGIDIQVGATELKTTAVEVMIKGGPVSRIRWRILSEGNKVRVFLNTILKGKIDESYLNDLAHYMYTAFNALVLSAAEREPGEQI